MSGSNIKKKKVIIAGSEGLLGSEIVKKFKRKYNLVKLDLALGHDLTDENQVIQIMNSHSDCIGIVNLFCLNSQPNDQTFDLFSLPLDSVRKYFETNVMALFSVCREFAKAQKRPASIVNFSSIYGVSSPKHFIYEEDFTKHIGYTISKSAVLGMSKYLATYLAPKVRVNTIVPGGVFNNQIKSFTDNYSAMTPMKRMMNPEEIISTVEYLLSENTSYTTGSTIHVDGGWCAW